MLLLMDKGDGITSFIKLVIILILQSFNADWI